MRFEAKLPAGIDAWALGVAGLDNKDFIEVSINRFESKKRPSFPVTIQSRYLSAEKSLATIITIFGFGERECIDRWLDKKGKIVIKRRAKPKVPTHIAIEIADQAAGESIQRKLEHYSLENDGEGIWWREHCELYEQIDEILKPDGLSSAKLQQGEGVLSRRAILALMELSEKLEGNGHGDINHLFSDNWVPKSERSLVAPWLLKRFVTNPEADDQIGMRIWDNAVPEIAEDLIRAIENRRYDHHRGPLCQALAKTKHPRAADVIASVMEEKWMALWCLSALSKVRGAEKHIPKIQKFLRNPEGDVRREANKLLKKLGVVVETPPPPVHLVKARGKIPPNLEEWSTNLDMDDLGPTLQKLSGCIGSGFAQSEIAEVVAVAEQMKPDQTKAFRFAVTAAAEPVELWVVIFLDDIDSPDLYVHSTPAIIRKLEALTIHEEK